MINKLNKNSSRLVTVNYLFLIVATVKIQTSETSTYIGACVSNPAWTTNYFNKARVKIGILKLE